MNATALRGPVISGWTAVSPFGLGAAAFAAGLHAGRPATRTTTTTMGLTVRTVPDFDPRAALGRKGTRSMDRVTALAVAALGEFGTPDSRSALVLGTHGSQDSMMGFTRSSLVEEKPFYVDPARFPNTVMNCAAGQCAIWHGLRGPNATIAGGRVATLLALAYAHRLQRSARATTVFCGGADEHSAARADLRHRADPRATVLGEGCALLWLEPAGSAGRAEVAALEFGAFSHADRTGSAVAETVDRLLTRTGTAPQQIWAHAPTDAAEVDALPSTAAASAIRVRSEDLIGDTTSAAAAFQIAAILALAARQPAATDRFALVTATDPSGIAGAALLRILPCEHA